MPSSPNPHLGFRGDINGEFGGIQDYGVYAEALVPMLERHGYDATVFYGGVDRLKSEIDQGHPIVVWITAGREARPVYRRHYEGNTFKLIPGEHTVVVYGYDDAGVYVMDVGDGGKYYTDWDFIPSALGLLRPNVSPDPPSNEQVEKTAIDTGVHTESQCRSERWRLP